MGFIKWLLWTCFSVGLGVLLASYEVGGRTPVDHLKRVWKDEAPRVHEVIDEAKKTFSAKQPKEHYTPEERSELNKLLARQGERRK